jgi:tape measure domain-containing protein
MAEESRLVIVVDSKNAERNAINLGKELDSIEKKGDFASKSMDGLSVATRSLAGQMAGLVTVGAAVAKMDAYTGMQNRLKLVTSSQQDLNTAMNDTFKIAQKSYQTWDSVIQVYQRFSDNAKTLGINMKQTAVLTETVSKAVAISGASTQAAEAALTQFGQSLASGVFRGEEFNSVAEQTPALLKAIATGLGVSIGELRKMANEGKLTTDVLIKGLDKSREYVDNLFSKTDMTISQSLTLLNNEVTKFVGEAGKASGAASAMAESIKLLGENLSTIADIAVLGGIAYLTKAIIAQTTSIYGSVAATAAQRAATIAQQQASIAAATATLNEAKAHLANIQATNAETQAKFGAAAASARYKLASDAVTRALAAQTAAQTAANTASSLGSRALGLVGGWTGVITLGITALAAGYMYLQKRTADANAKLEEQAQVANKAKEELLALKGVERQTAINDLTTAFAAQNKELEKSKEAVNNVLFAIRASSVENEKARKVTEDARKGLISYSEAAKQLNGMNISPELYNMLMKQVNAYDENAIKADKSQKALKVFGIEVKLSGSNAQNAVSGIDANTRSMTENERAAAKAAKAQKDFKASLFDREFEAQLTSKLLNKGYTPEQVADMVKTAAWAQKNGVKITNDLYQASLKVLDIEQKNKDIIDAKSNAEKERTKELEKQQAVLKLNAKVQENAAKYNFGGLESKYNLPKGTLSTIHAIETGNTGKTNQVNRDTGATGGFQFLASTAKQYGVKDRTNLAQSAEGAAKYMRYLLDLFKGDLEKAVRAYHAGEGNVQRGTNLGKYNNDYWKKFQGYIAGQGGYSAGDISSKDFEKMLDDSVKLLEQQAESRKALELDVANEVTKIREGLKDKLKEIDEAQFSPEEKAKLVAEYTARAENDIAVANQALKTKLDDYSNYLKSEEQLLKDSYAQRQFDVMHDLTLTKDQREEATKHLQKQLEIETAAIRLAKEERMFQLQEQFLTENQAIEKRYALEVQKLAQINDIEERNHAAEMLRLDKEKKQWNLLKDARDKWNGTKAEIGGYSDFANIANTRDVRVGQSQDLLNADLAAAGENQAAIEDALKNHYDRLIDIQRNYNLASYDLQLGYGSSIAGSFADMFKSLQGEQSSAYKVMFAASKAFSIAQSTISIISGIAQAANNPWPLNLAAMATVAASTATLVSDIQSVGAIGFATGGYTGNMGKTDVAGVVHGQEYVLNAAATKRIGVDTLNSINSGGGIGSNVNITINVPQGYTAAQSQDSSGNVTIDVVRSEIDQSWQRVTKANSKESRVIQSTFGIQPKR